VGLWTAIKRLNKKSDNWSRPAFERMIANIDSHGGRSATKHISVRDLITHGLKPEKTVTKSPDLIPVTKVR
jgi:hypothetical protein